MDRDPKALILVIGATGTQGGAIAHGLLAHGFRVRILCRNPDSPAALALVNAGAEIVPGNLNDTAVVNLATRGATGVFSVQATDITGTDSERRHGFMLVQAAQRAGVRQFVHSSVTANGTHSSFPRWGSGYWNEKYWTDKWAVEEAVVSADFPFCTVLRPAFIMENFIPPKVSHLFPDLHRGELATALHPETRMQLIAANDIAAFACAAFAEPAAFNGKTIELAAEALTMAQIAATLDKVLGRSMISIALSPEEAVQRGLYPAWVRTQEFRNEIGYHVDMGSLKSWGIALTSFSQWVADNSAHFQTSPELLTQDSTP